MKPTGGRGNPFFLLFSSGKASSPAASCVPGGFYAGETLLRLLGRNACHKCPVSPPSPSGSSWLSPAGPGGLGRGLGGSQQLHCLCWESWQSIPWLWRRPKPSLTVFPLVVPGGG